MTTGNQGQLTSDQVGVLRNRFAELRDAFRAQHPTNRELQQNLVRESNSLTETGSMMTGKSRRRRKAEAFSYGSATISRWVADKSVRHRHRQPSRSHRDDEVSGRRNPGLGRVVQFVSSRKGQFS